MGGSITNQGVGGGTVTTAGNIVVQVLNNGKLRVYSADKGEKLLDVDTPARNGMGPPITYMLDGKQYIAIATGVCCERPNGRVSNSRRAVANNPETRDQVNSTILYVFGL